MTTPYLFTSDRLGFRTWLPKDLAPLAEMCADPEVMQHFPKTLSSPESEAFLTRLNVHFDTWGYTYFAVELLETGEFIGFVGLAYQEYDVAFCPAVDIGWRLKRSAWGNGFATEGALRCLALGRSLNIESLFAVCTVGNVASERVMQKIGMSKADEFDHPLLNDYPNHQRCVRYTFDYTD